MAWSGRDALVARWLPRFASRHLLEISIDKYITQSYALDDQRADEWVQRDHVRDQELAAIADPEDTHVGPSRYDLNACYHCYGRGFVRKDVDRYSPDFGRVFRCPACNGIDSPDVQKHCEKCRVFSAAQDGPERNQCWKCRQYEDEPAAESCTNPRWHLPNANLPAPASPAGWKRLA